MDLGSIFLILALFFLVAVFIGRPLIEGKEHNKNNLTQNTQEHDLSSLLAERDRILNAIQELDFDHTLGKIPGDEYPVQRATLVQRGSDILRQLDTLSDIDGAVIGVQHEREYMPVSSGESDAVVNSVVSRPDDQLEALIANRRRGRTERSAGFCPSCGGPVRKSDRFCPKCGCVVG